MSASKFVLVVYDISDDRRRTRLHEALKDFGTPVQYSVFECLVDDRQLKRMKQAVRKRIRPRLDRVRFYYLCEACRGRTEVTSGVAVLGEQQAVVVGD